MQFASVKIATGTVTTFVSSTSHEEEELDYAESEV